MKKFLVSLLAVLTALVGVAWGAALPASAASPASLRLMPLGDSITWGVGSSTGNSYRSALWNELASEGHALDFVGSQRNGTMSDPDNEGHSGWRIERQWISPAPQFGIFSLVS